MKARLTALVVLLLLGASAYAQEEDPPFFKQFSVEIAAGVLPPIHTLLEVNGTKYDKSFARDGKEPDMDGAWMPALSLSAVWKTARRWEMVLTGGVSWCHHKVIQYGTFGIDPQGNPRYNLKDPHPDGWRNSAPIGTLFFQARCFWNPTQKVKLYSAFGGGLVLGGKDHFFSDGLVAIVPSITPIAVRFGTGPLTFFLENTYSPAATGFDIGLGCTF